LFFVLRGILKLAEVASRFPGINSFIKAMKKFGFAVLKRVSYFANK